MAIFQYAIRGRLSLHKLTMTHKLLEKAITTVMPTKRLLKLTIFLAVFWGAWGRAETPKAETAAMSMTTVDSPSESRADSEIVFTTRAPNWVVDIRVSDSAGDCNDLKPIGNLFYDAQLREGGVLGFIQKLNPIKPNENLELTYKVAAGTQLKVRTHATTSGGYNGYCGPVSVQFLVGESRKYRGDFKLEGGGCWLELTDVTSPEEEPYPIPAQKVYCK